MLPKIVAPLVALAAAGFVTGASAQDYRASDIVKHFSPAADLGASRALCIGTESECAKNVAPKPKAGNFDLVVNFEYNSATLTKAARGNLDQFASALKDPRLTSSAFVVEGYTDGKGSDGYNLDLSSKRAAAVVDYLKQQGVETAKLEAKGYGKTKPRSADPLDPSNRRVETRLRIE